MTSRWAASIALVSIAGLAAFCWPLIVSPESGLAHGTDAPLVGWGAGLLPPLRGRAEIAMLAAYGTLAGLAYGLLLNLSF
jgi:hypothetical protein